MSAVKTGRYVGTDEQKHMQTTKTDKPVRVTRPIQLTAEKWGQF